MAPHRALWNEDPAKESVMGVILMRDRVVAPLFLCCLVALGGCLSEEIVRVRGMPIASVDLSTARDGTYRGSYSYGSFTYVVQTTVKSRHIETITVIKNRNTLYARKAEGVIPRVLEAQSPDVDAVTGATTTSKALLKAIENSLRDATKAR
jgi:uncharacterized protein with FMN-binding domain